MEQIPYSLSLLGGGTGYCRLASLSNIKMGAKIYNSNLTQEMVDSAKLQVGNGGIPQELAEKVIPVMEVNPKLLRITNFVTSANGTGNTNTTVFNASAAKDFYLTSVSLSAVKDATCDMATGNLVVVAVTCQGRTAYLLNLPCLTLTAQQAQLALNFSPPIKIDRGSTITMDRGGAITAGTCSRSCSITGYYVDNITA